MRTEVEALLVVLLGRLDGHADVSQDELATARKRLAENEVCLIAYPPDRLEQPDLLRVELRLRTPEEVLGAILADTLTKDAIPLKPRHIPFRDRPRPW